MKHVILFEKGDKVKVIKPFCNASQHTSKIEKAALTGVYEYDWENSIFEIEGSWEPEKYEFEPMCYAAYLLLLDGVSVGYVYNNALEIVKQ